MRLVWKPMKLEILYRGNNPGTKRQTQHILSRACPSFPPLLSPVCLTWRTSKKQKTREETLHRAGHLKEGGQKGHILAWKGWETWDAQVQTEGGRDKRVGEEIVKTRDADSRWTLSGWPPGSWSQFPSGAPLPPAVLRCGLKGGHWLPPSMPSAFPGASGTSSEFVTVTL